MVNIDSKKLLWKALKVLNDEEFAAPNRIAKALKTDWFFALGMIFTLEALGYVSVTVSRNGFKHSYEARLTVEGKRLLEQLSKELSQQ